MASVNKVILVGNLGADPELRHTSSGKAVAELRIATTFKFGDEEKTEWHRVILWERRAEVAAEFLQKGSPVYIEGRIQTRSFDDKDGNKRYITEIVGEQMQLLGKRAETSGAEEAQPEPEKKTRRARKPTREEGSYAGDDSFGEE